jgi:HD-like signal output (HDOD) protein
MLTTTAQPTARANKIVTDAVTDLGEIATLPEVTVKIIQVVENPKSTARDLHEIIKNDPALSTRLLKVVNSAFYGLPGQIASVDRAIVLLGLSAVKNIAIAASMTHLFNSSSQIEGMSSAEVWKHSIGVAVCCRMISAAQGRPNVEESFLAGLIHDIGLLVERQVFPKQLAHAVARHHQQGGDFCEVEREIIGADHQAFGMALATKWRFPSTLCTAIGYHHKPMELAPVNQELSIAVHVADVLACRQQIGFSMTAANEQYSEEMLERLKLNPSIIEDIVEKLPEQVAVTESIFS